jgi:hypothetical protein
MLDILAGVLSGGRFGAGLGAPGSAQFFLTLDVTRFMPLDAFLERIDDLIDQLHAATLIDGVERVYVAGEIEFGLEEARNRDGIPLDVPVVEALDRVEAELGSVDDVGSFGSRSRCRQSRRQRHPACARNASFGVPSGWRSDSTCARHRRDWKPRRHPQLVAARARRRRPRRLVPGTRSGFILRG